MGKRKTTEQFIEEARAIHGDKYDYTETVYTGALSKLNITCPKHGVFSQRPSDHLSGNGCMSCFKERNRLGREDFLLRAFEQHNNKFKYGEITYKGGRGFVDIYCPEHGKFNQNMISHLAGKGCNKCAQKVRRDSVTFTLDTFIEECSIRNEHKYDYSLITEYHNSSDVFKITCPVHGVFEQKGSYHLSGYGCQRCAWDKSKEMFGYTLEQYLAKVKEVHEDYYKYDIKELPNVEVGIEIICPVHGVFNQNARSHLRGAGCPSCAYQNKARAFTRKQVEDNKEKLLTQEGGVYILYIEDLNSYKIGISNNPKSRMQDIRRESGLNSSLIHYKEFDRYDSALLELKLHSFYKDKNRNFGKIFQGYTELFELSADDLTYCISLIEEY